jgi:hypothetical protein
MLLPISAGLRAPISIRFISFNPILESPHSNFPPILFPISIIFPFQLLIFENPWSVSSGGSLLSYLFSLASLLDPYTSNLGNLGATKTHKLNILF